MELSPLQILEIAGIYTFATTFATATGAGSSFITQPAMLFFGLPIKQAVATDIVSDIFTELTMIWQYEKKKLIDWKIGGILTLFSSCGALLGSQIFQWISASFLMHLMIVMVIVLNVFHLYNTFFKKKKTEVSHHKTHHVIIVALITGFVLGIYNNILSLGEGTLGTMILLNIIGLPYLKSRGTVQLIFIPARIVALIMTALHGFLYLPLVAVLWICGFVSGYLGSKISFIIPEKYLRTVFSGFALLITMILVTKYWLS